MSKWETCRIEIRYLDRKESRRKSGFFIWAKETKLETSIQKWVAIASTLAGEKVPGETVPFKQVHGYLWDTNLHEIDSYSSEAKKLMSQLHGQNVEESQKERKSLADLHSRLYADGWEPIQFNPDGQPIV